MKEEKVEIYSDASNNAVMRHPGRNYPGLLIQGDSLSNLCSIADEIRQEFENGEHQEALEGLEILREELWQRFLHYKRVMSEHGEDISWGDEGPNPPIRKAGDDDT